MRHRGSGPPILSPSARLRLASRRNSRNSLGPGAAGGLAAGPPGMAGARGVLGNAFDIDVALPQFGSQSTIKRQLSSRSWRRRHSHCALNGRQRPSGSSAAAAASERLERIAEQTSRAAGRFLSMSETSASGRVSRVGGVVVAEAITALV